MATAQQQNNPQFQNQQGRRMTRGEVVNQIEELGREGTHDAVMGACRFAIDFVKSQGADDEYADAISLINAAAVAVPGTKTIWTERRLREFVDLGVKRPGL